MTSNRLLVKISLKLLYSALKLYYGVIMQVKRTDEPVPIMIFIGFVMTLYPSLILAISKITGFAASVQG